MPESSVSHRAGGDNTEKVDAEHESDSEPGGFTISVDLSACVGAPARCRVWVRRRARKVRWLASRVRRAAKLRGSLLLLAGDHLLPPSEPLRVLRSDDTLHVARVEHEWQHAFSFADSDEDAPTNPPPTQSTPAVVQPTSPKKITSKIRKPKPVTPVVPSFKRKFTVSDTLFLLNQTVEERTPTTDSRSETEHPPSAERFQPTSEVGHVTQKSITMDQEPEPNVDHDALNRVKRRALALLEQVADEKDTDVVDAPKKKRRRVRRRRPAPKPYNPEESVQELDDSGPVTIQNGSQILNQRNYVDMTKELDDSESKTKLRLLGLVTNENQDPSKDQDTDNDSNINGAGVTTAQSPSPAHSAVLSPKALTPTLLAAQPSPQWVMDFAELPSETQVPVLVRNSAPPRAPRVVHALGS